MTRRIVPKVAVLLNIAALLSFIYPHDVATPIHTVAPMVEELVTGERIQALCDIVILSKEYAELYPKMLGYSHSVVYTDELLSDVVRMNIKHSRTFFLKLDWIDFFKKVVLPEIEAPFVLFTHNSDFVSGQDNDVLRSHFLKKWYGQNMQPGPLVQGIPIGLENTMWGRTDFDLIQRYRASKKTRLAYFRFNTYSNEVVRKDTRLNLLQNGFEENESREWAEYIQELSQHQFCFCPVGNGPDTHRMWEAIYLGVIPIVVRTPELTTWFGSANILWVTDLKLITPSYLEQIHFGTQKIPEIATMSWLYKDIEATLASS